MDIITNIDLAINLRIQEYLRTEWLNPYVRIFTSLNNGGFLVILTVILFLLLKKYREVGTVMAVSLAIEFVLNNLMFKPLFARPRPYEISEEIVLLVRQASDYSFPSGHTGSAFAISVAMYLMLPKDDKLLGIYAVLLASFMGFSRLYVGIHYPSDVIGGIILGVFTSFVSVWGFRRYMKRTLSPKI